MAVEIPRAQIQNYQEMEVVVAGPDDVNRLFIIDGKFDCDLAVNSQGVYTTRKEIFTVLIGPVFTRKQFAQANATASLTNTFVTSVPTGVVVQSGWFILGIDADWDDESGQVELRIEAEVVCHGTNVTVKIDGFAFHVTILAAMDAA